MPYTAVPRGGMLPTSPPTPVAQRLDTSDTDSVHDDLRRGYGGLVPAPSSSHSRAAAAAAAPPALTPSERLARSVHQGTVHHRAVPRRASGPQQRAARAATVSSLLGRAATTASPPSTAAASSSCGGDDLDDDDVATSFSCESASPATVPLSHRSSVCGSSSSSSGSFCAGSHSDAAARDQSVASSTSSWAQPVPPRFAARHSQQQQQQQQARANVAAEPVTEPLRPFQLRTILLSTDDEQPPKEARQTILSGHNFLSFMSGGSSDGGGGGGTDQPTPTPAAAAAAATAAAAAAAQQQRVTVSVSPVPAEEVEDDPLPVPPPTPPSPALPSSTDTVVSAASAAALPVSLPSTCFAERSGIVFRSPSDEAPVSSCAHAQQPAAADAAPFVQAQVPTLPAAACVAGTVPPSVVPMAALKAAGAAEAAAAGVGDDEDDDAWWRCSISPPSRSGSGYPTSSVAPDAAAAFASADAAAEVSVATAMTTMTTTTTMTTVVAEATAAAATTVESTHSDALPLLGQRGRRVVEAARAASVSAASSSSSSSSSALSIEGPRSGAAGGAAALPPPAAQSEECEEEAALAECLIAQYEGVEVDVEVEESEEGGGGGDVAQTTRVSVVTASVATEHATVSTTRSLTTYSPSKGVVASSRATARVEALTAGGGAGEEERSSLSPGRFAASSETPQRGVLAKEDELWGLSLLEESPAAEMPEKLSVQLYSDTPSPVRAVSAESARDEAPDNREQSHTDAESCATTLEQRSCLSGRPSSPLDESVYSESPLSLEAIVNLGQRVESIVAEKNSEISVLRAKIASLEAALALERGGGGGGGGGGGVASDAGSFRSCVLTQTDVDACCGSPVTCPAPLTYDAAAAPPPAAAAAASASAHSTSPSPSPPPPPQVQRCDKQVQASGGDDITLATMLDTAQIQAALDRASGLSRCFPPPVEQLSAADLKALDTKCASLTSMVVHVEALVQQNATLAIRCLDSIINQGSHAPQGMGSAGAALVATAAAGDGAGVAAFGEAPGGARAPSPELLVASHTNAQFAILTNRLLSVTVQQQRRIAQLLLLMGMGQHEGGRRMKG